ncbi:hypothetical protein DL240_06235 [Lujinxingia litoralis]|uniref:Outer membrane beta-barrel domain-containing protein n=1 Tax=Lujinxingia litoralis TaxID=2211119 RepID=A0A328CCV1_9DELT|nr:outer membrane beta-barrel domain-containing protein [Lujinxingia litoralis]RAL23751.1 hypothetical protein DL240_06235 [Lujinxingia litoralis]
MKKSNRWPLVFALVLSAMWMPHTPAQAAESDEIAAVESGPIVRRQLLHRSARFELQPMVAFTMNDAYTRNGMVGVSGTYFLNNSFGLGASFQYGAFHPQTNLRENLERTLAEGNEDARLERLSYSSIGWAADVGFTYVPIFGKFSVMNSFFSHYDLHLFGGMVIVNEGVEPAIEGFATDEGIAGTRPGGYFGGGARFFLSDMFALNFQVRNYLYNRAEISSGSASPQLSNTVMLSVGLGIFLPGEVKISR